MSPLAWTARQVAPIGFVVVIFGTAQLSLALGTGMRCAVPRALTVEVGDLFLSPEAS